MVKKVTDRSTKSEILGAFNELMEEKKALELQLKNSPKEPAKATPPKSNPESKVTMTHDRMTTTIENIFKLQSGFGGAVSELSEKLTTEASKLAELEESVTQEVEQLKSLHGLEEIEDDTLGDLIQSYEDYSKQFDREKNQRRETLEQAVQEQIKAWKKEQEERDRTIKERNEEHRKTRQRDEQEYKYDLELRRKLADEQYSQSQSNLYKQLQDALQEQEKLWTEREKAIAEREKQYEEYKSKVESFEKEKEAAIKKAKEEGKGIANYQVKIKSDLQNKEVEGQKRFYELRIQSLEQTIQNQESRIQGLSKQLDAALKQVQDLAVKAIEGASNMNSVQTLKDILQEQTKQMKVK